MTLLESSLQELKYQVSQVSTDDMYDMCVHIYKCIYMHIYVCGIHTHTHIYVYVSKISCTIRRVMLPFGVPKLTHYELLRKSATHLNLEILTGIFVDL